MLLLQFSKAWLSPEELTRFRSSCSPLFLNYSFGTVFNWPLDECTPWCYISSLNRSCVLFNNFSRRFKPTGGTCPQPPAPSRPTKLNHTMPILRGNQSDQMATVTGLSISTTASTSLSFFILLYLLMVRVGMMQGPATCLVRKRWEKFHETRR